MLCKNATAKDLEKALALVNQKYEGNITFRRFDVEGKRIHFTLRCKDSKGPGHRRHFSYFGHPNGRRSPSACWHVHGDFFDALFLVCPSAEVRSAGRIVNKDEGNWIDWNVGSQMCPVMYSDSCDCQEGTVKSFRVDQGELTSDCWLVQFQGLDACKTCEFLNTDECGGKAIREKIADCEYPAQGIGERLS